jgi:competence CoiA-like predicted nuclease
MKLVVTLLFVTICFSRCLAQVPQTTEEEYNYMTKGYKVQLESGLDMKKGYVFEDMGAETKIGNYSFMIKVLQREAKKEVAGILVITKSNVAGKTYYMGIPMNNVEMLKRYYADLSALDKDHTTIYCYLISAVFVDVFAEAEELEKKLAEK